MMASLNLISNIQDGFQRVVVLLKQVANDLNGKIGDRSALNTTNKTSLVAAINEVKASSGSSNIAINDSTSNSTSTWSSSKISSSIDGAITSLIGGADVDNDTLKEIADRITTLAQADIGLVSVNSQTFSEVEKGQARSNIGAASITEFGDIEAADFVATINAAYAGGV